MEPVESSLPRIRLVLQEPAQVNLSRLFAPSFFSHTPEALLRSRLEHLVAECGPLAELEIRELKTGHSALVHARFSRGFVADGEVAVDDHDPPRIQWLNFEMPRQEHDDSNRLQRHDSRLPGTFSFMVRSLDDDQVFAALDEHRLVGMGSASKLWIFLALARAIERGELQWQDVVRLEAGDRSLPTGVLQDWPEGSPLTLHSVAALLLGLSDNTAADLLLRQLGRARVEEELAACSPAGRGTNTPFASTRGMFALVAGDDALHRAWVDGEAEERRRLLEDLETSGAGALADVAAEWPPGIDWNFSASDLCAALASMRHSMAKDPVARDLFAMTHTALSLFGWSFAGFKGGSSAGRAAFAVLVADETGHWSAVALGVNAAPQDAVVEAAVALVKRAVELLRLR